MAIEFPTVWVAYVRQHPIAIDELGQGLVTAKGGLQARDRAIDDEDCANGRMHLGHLSREADAQISAGALDHTHVATDIHGHLRTRTALRAAVKVLEAYAAAHDECGPKNLHQIRADVVVLAGVIAREEGAPPKEDPTRELAAANHDRGVRGVPKLRPGLAEVCGAHVHMGQSLRLVAVAIGQHEFAAPLEGVSRANFVDQAPDPFKARSRGPRCIGNQVLDVEILDELSAGVVKASDEARVRRDPQPVLPLEHLAHSGVVSGLRQEAGVRAALPAATSPAIVRRVEGVVHCPAAVANDDHHGSHPRHVTTQAEVTEDCRQRGRAVTGAHRALQTSAGAWVDRALEALDEPALGRRERGEEQQMHRAERPEEQRHQQRAHRAEGPTLPSELDAREEPTATEVTALGLFVDVALRGMVLRLGTLRRQDAL
mmetsp:Transcript_88569/g.255470  ORF Transcript_88569/g.255470 Transcript_88569/m.255470 type:complete len:429 (-) Transcript_88569:524-1810(-)